MQTKKLIFETVTAGNRAELLSFTIPKVDDEAEFIRMGHTGRGFYLNAIQGFEKDPISCLCRTPEGEIIAAFYIAFENANTRIKTSSHLVSNNQFLQILDEIVRLSQHLGLTEKLSIHCFEKLTRFTSLIEKRGFEKGDEEDVLMERILSDSSIDSNPSNAFTIRAHDPTDAVEVSNRMLAQTSGFSEQDLDSLGKWAIMAKDHMAHFCKTTEALDLIAINETGTITSAAGIDIDPISKIGEFEPIATSHRFKRKGYAQAVMNEGLRRMYESRMERAYVRTLSKNIPAINAYKSVGFEKIDQAHNYYYRTK